MVLFRDEVADADGIHDDPDGEQGDGKVSAVEWAGFAIEQAGEPPPAEGEKRNGGQHVTNDGEEQQDLEQEHDQPRTA